MKDGLPTGVRWKGEGYAVAEVPARRHPRDRRWASFARADFRGAEADRTYCRVRCPDQQVLALPRDAAGGPWVLARAHD